MKSAELPPWLWPRAAYVHVPFCAHHCGYCDFAVVTGQDDRTDHYIKALARELALLGEPQPVSSIFFGGGTPTHPKPEQLRQLLEIVLSWFSILPGAEISVEANPDTLTREKVRILRDLGVTRVSLGAQSFRPEMLRTLERDHKPEEIPRAVSLIRDAGMDVSLDLIFGVPGQSLADWSDDLESAVRLKPTHISTYGLTYEKGTRLWKQRQRGELRPLLEEEERAMYALAMEQLALAGFEHYEISNFSKPGKRCQHNEVYWANEAYFGVGLGAARYILGRREQNTRSFDEYLNRMFAGTSPTVQCEELTPFERAKETMAIQLRRAAGISCQRFREQTNYEVFDVAGPRLGVLVDQGLLLQDEVSIRLSQEGKFVADAVIENLL